jgi:hypothetical protein
VILTRTRLVGTRRVRFPHAECAFYTFDTHECDSYMQSVISTRSVVSTGTNVIPTRKSVISTRTRLTSTTPITD